MFLKFKKYFSLDVFFVFLTIVLFIGFKIYNLSLRFGDSNAYLYMAQVLREGILPYRDYFLSDPPFMIILFSFLGLFFGGNLILFQFLPVLFEVGGSISVYLILKKWGNPFAFLGPLLLLSSFTVLSTSDYITGVQLVVFFTSTAILFWEKEKPILSGIFWAIALLIKLYVIPALFGFILFILLKKEFYKLKKFILAFVVTVILVFVYFLGSINQILNYLFFLHFNRPMGNDKWYVISFFLKKEWLFIVLTILSFIFVKKKRWAVIFPFLCLVLFFLIFRDLYYLYFDSFFFYLILLSLEFLGFLWLKGDEFKRLVIIPLTFILIFLLFSFSVYYKEFIKQGIFFNSEEIALYVKNLTPNFDIYGSHEIAPLIAIKSQKKIFNNKIDTNTQVFASGLMDLKEVSEQAVKNGIYLIAKIQDFPEYNIKDFGLGGFFDESVFKTSCQRLRDFPVIYSSEKIAIYKCYK